MNKEKIIASVTMTLGLAGALVFSDSLWVDTLLCTIPDPKTNMTCLEISENPERDVYYIVLVADIDNDERFLETAHQHRNTLRTSLDGTKAIVKYDVGIVARGIDLGEPFTNEEMLEYLQNPVNGFVETEEFVKEKDQKEFATDNLIE